MVEHCLLLSHDSSPAVHHIGRLQLHGNGGCTFRLRPTGAVLLLVHVAPGVKQADAQAALRADALPLGDGLLGMVWIGQAAEGVGWCDGGRFMDNLQAI